ncbi:MAG: DUF928 domain-containing protein [Leptolyngbyaceae cyanobacterium RU_5_1]|nr:DUF928 domain-containing protein [Leptolyngbyaceae cyanobacterium RU_5_1]
MNNIQLSNSTVVFASTLALLTAFSSATPARSQSGAIATPPSSVSIRFQPPAALPPPPVVNDPGDGRSQGGAGRRSCLLALVPQVGTKATYWGLTTTARPTFWFHLTEQFDPSIPIKLTLRDRSGQSIYTTTLSAPNTPSIVISAPIPTSAPALQVNTAYSWDVTYRCKSGTRVPKNPDEFVDLDDDRPIAVITGGIQRIAPSSTLQRQIRSAKTPLDRATLYANNGIWYDSLTTLGQQVQGKKPVDSAIVRAWFDLLRQANLQPSASTPVAACCKPTE